MSSHRYDIHGMVEVLISEDVRPEVVKEIEFQIGAFRDAQNSPPNPDVPKINIKSYLAGSSYWQGKEEALFYQSRGVIGQYVRNDEDKMLVGRGANELNVCADYANFLINLYIQLAIVKQGFTMAHAAAYRSSSGTINVLTGAGGIGKTAVLGYAVSEKGLPHLGDDIVILGGNGECKAFPRQFVLKAYHQEVYSKVFKEKRLPRWNMYGLKRFIIDNAPFVGFAKKTLKRSGCYYRVANLLRPQPYLATVSPDELFGQGSMIRSGTVGRIVYMDRVSRPDFAVRAITAEELVNRMVSVIHYEWKDVLTHLVTLGALDVVDVAGYFDGAIAVFRQVVDKAELIQIDIPEKATPQELICFLDKEGYF